jgi:hypothetical protein
MIFLMRQQQWFPDEFNAYKEYTHAAWLEHKKSADVKPVSENVLGNFERLLSTTDDWINDIIQKGPVTESSSKRAKVVKSDRHKITLVDMIQENQFTNFTQFVEGIADVSEHFKVLYKQETGRHKALYLENLAQKPLTSQLYPYVKLLFEKSSFRFRQHYPYKSRQWQYWVMRAIISLQIDEATTKQWYEYLDNAQKIETDTSQLGHYIPKNANFPLGADFDFSEPAVLTQNATESLSARIDRLNDW